MRISLPASTLFACLAAVILTGCAGQGAPASTTPPATSTATATAATAEPTPAPTIRSDAPAARPGCPSNGAVRPNDTYAAPIPDIDGDGLPDSQWYAESSPFRYGITTASGATFSVADGLAGPGQHSGWSARLSSGVVVTVLDDSRGATLHTIVGCEFVTPLDVTGSAYTFDMHDLRGHGTGVGCRPGASGPELNGFQALERSDGTFDVTATQITVSADGRTARNGPRSESTGLSMDDPIVAEAQTSSCGAIPVVATSGR